MGMGIMGVLLLLVAMVIIRPSLGQTGPPACASDFLTCAKSDMGTCCTSMTQLVSSPTCFCQLVDFVGPVNAAALNQALPTCGITATVNSLCAGNDQSTAGMSTCQIKLKKNCQNIDPTDTNSVCCPVMKAVVENEAKCFCDLMQTTLQVGSDFVDQGLTSCGITGTLSTICNPGSIAPSNGTPTAEAPSTTDEDSPSPSTALPATAADKPAPATGGGSPTTILSKTLLIAVMIMAAFLLH